MTEEPARYDISPEPQPEGGEKFCPFGLAASTGPLGKLSMHRPPCDPAHCALGDPFANQCTLKTIAEALVGIDEKAEALARHK